VHFSDHLLFGDHFGQCKQFERVRLAQVAVSPERRRWIDFPRRVTLLDYVRAIQSGMSLSWPAFRPAFSRFHTCVHLFSLHPRC
jgi:hypothetical protein